MQIDNKQRNQAYAITKLNKSPKWVYWLYICKILYVLLMNEHIAKYSMDDKRLCLPFLNNVDKVCLVNTV